MIKRAGHPTLSKRKQTHRTNATVIAAFIIIALVLSSGCITKGDATPGTTTVSVVSVAVDNTSISASDPEAERLFIDGLTYNAQNCRFEEAITCFDEAIAIEPDFKDSWAFKGTTLTDMGRQDEAAYCFEQADTCTAGKIAAQNKIQYPSCLDK